MHLEGAIVLRISKHFPVVSGPMDSFVIFSRGSVCSDAVQRNLDKVQLYRIPRAAADHTDVPAGRGVLHVDAHAELHGAAGEHDLGKHGERVCKTRFESSWKLRVKTRSALAIDEQPSKRRSKRKKIRSEMPSSSYMKCRRLSLCDTI